MGSEMCIRDSSGAVVIPVLARDSVVTYTPQNVKSFFCEFGSGNANKYTADIEVNREKYAEVTSVTDFTFSGELGKKFIECNGLVEILLNSYSKEI